MWALKSHAMFHAVERLDFPLLSDFDGEVARRFGLPVKRGGRTPMVDAAGKPMRQGGQVMQAPRGVTLWRSTFVVGLDGKILYRNDRPSPVADALEVLKVLSEDVK